jgi:hypothetical protein
MAGQGSNAAAACAATRRRRRTAGANYVRSENGVKFVSMS